MLFDFIFRQYKITQEAIGKARKFQTFDNVWFKKAIWNVKGGGIHIVLKELCHGHLKLIPIFVKRKNVIENQTSTKLRIRYFKKQELIAMSVNSKVEILHPLLSSVAASFWPVITA